MSTTRFRVYLALACLAFVVACLGFIWQDYQHEQAAESARTYCEIQGRKWDGNFYPQRLDGTFYGPNVGPLGLYVGNGREVLWVDAKRRHAFYCWDKRDLP